MKKYLFTILLGFSVSIVSAETLSFEKVNVYPIRCREGKSSEVKDLVAESYDFRLNEKSCLNSAAAYIESGERKEALDSIIVTDLNGKPVSRDLYTYTEIGQPYTHQTYSMPKSNGSLGLTSTKTYEYDNLHRVVSIETTYAQNKDQNIKYEMQYTGESDLYNTLIYYVWYKKEFTPNQKAEYAFDEFGNTISQIFYSWDINAEEWIPVQRSTTEFDSLNRQLSLFNYD